MSRVQSIPSKTLFVLIYQIENGMEWSQGVADCIGHSHIDLYVKLQWHHIEYVCLDKFTMVLKRKKQLILLT
jgi:hypothetical protein